MLESMPAEDRGEILDAEEYEKKGYGKEIMQPGFVAGAGDNLVSMIETDQFEAAAKKHKLREEAQRKKKEMKKRDKKGQLEYKSDEENPYDSEEREYDQMVNHDEPSDEEDEDHNTYDSELEEEFFGKKDPDLNKQLNNKREKTENDQIDSSSKPKFNPNDFRDKIDDVN